MTTPAASAAGSDSPATTTTSSSAPGAGPDWAASTKRVRDVSDWIVKAFVALSAVLIGSGPLLTHVADLHPDTRGVLAVAGAVVALAGAGLVTWKASDVNLTEVTDVYELLQDDPGPVEKLRSRLEKHPTTQQLYLLGYGSIKQLVAARAEQAANLSSQAAALNRVTTDAARAFVQANLARSQANIDAIDAALRNLTGWATYAKIRHRFDTVRPVLFAGAAAVVVGTVFWVGALGIDVAKKDDSTKQAATAGPQPGQIALVRWNTTGDTAAVASLREQLAEGGASMKDRACDHFGVLVEGGTGDPADPYQVAVLPNDPCPVRLNFDLDRRVATVTKFDAGDQVNAKVTLSAPRKINWPGGLVLLAVGLAGLVAGIAATVVFRK